MELFLSKHKLEKQVQSEHMQWELKVIQNKTVPERIVSSVILSNFLILVIYIQIIDGVKMEHLWYLQLV